MPPRKFDPDHDINEGDLLWVRVRVTRVQHEQSKLEKLTVLMSNGNKETLTWDQEEIRKDEE